MNLLIVDDEYIPSKAFNKIRTRGRTFLRFSVPTI